MSVKSQSTTGARAVRPAMITTIACLELAAAAWDARCFLNLNHAFPVSWGDALSLNVLMPALMCIAAIFAGVGLLQMRRSAWAVWMTRHAWLSGFYLLSIPALLWQSMFSPGVAFFITWRFTMVIFSLVAGMYLYAVRNRFDR
ncbi:MAG: hypothetical protein M3Y56_15790 [Armatimonadota bacterium]|nr:hypothetical protein [Armatimonadota bacterium]